MSGNHTPGPWAVHGDGYILAHGGKEEDIVAVCHSYGPDDFASRPHNARLIAAAPDMLARLRGAREWIANEIENIGFCDHEVGLCVCGDKSLLAAIDATIAKAAGGAS